MVQVLAQAGLYVPAASAVISPADLVATHFPNEEGGSIEGGRLAEEAARLAKSFGVASGASLLLLNESLASTSPGESLYLAEDVVRGLRFLGARAVYATHLHELGARVDRINEEVPGDSLVVSLAAGVEDGDGPARRTFRITRGPPVGLSYARDIADRYEISFERLRARIEDRRSAE
jgi:DNA mismatch repair protein MutS